MVSKKIKIEKIKNASSRQVTFCKRKAGLLKKAHDLAVLCDVDVGVIVFSGNGKMFQFANPSMHSVLGRYTNAEGEVAEHSSSTENVETNRSSHFTENLKALQRNVIGDDLKHMTLTDIIQLEQQIQKSLGNVQAKKDELLTDQLEDMKQKIAGAQKTANAHSSILNSVMEIFSTDRDCGEASERQVDFEPCSIM